VFTVTEIKIVRKKKGILTMFIVLPGYPIPNICQMLVCSSKTGLNIQY